LQHTFIAVVVVVFPHYRAPSFYVLLLLLLASYRFVIQLATGGDWTGSLGLTDRHSPKPSQYNNNHIFTSKKTTTTTTTTTTTRTAVSIPKYST